MRKNSIKNTRINGEVQRVLADIIRGEIKDPRINPLTSVVAVEVAPDLKNCKAYISVLGDELSAKDTLAGLRNTPDITFVMDQSIAYGVEMSKKIAEVNKDLKDEEEI